MAATTATTPSEKLLEETKALIQECLADGVVDAGEVLKIGMAVAEKVAKVKGMSAEEKKALVQTLVENALKATLSEEQYVQVGATLVQVLPAVLEIAASASRGELSLGDLARKARSGRWIDCLKGCFLTGPLQALVPSSLKKVVSSVNVTEPVAVAAEPVPVVEAPKEEPSQPSTPQPEAVSETTPSPDSPPSEESQTAPNQVPSPEASQE